MRWVLSGLMVCALLSACDSQNSAKARHSNSDHALSKSMQEDDSLGNTDGPGSAGEGGIAFSSTLIGASADGHTADVKLSYSVAAEYASIIEPRSTVSVKLINASGQVTLLARAAIDPATLSGEVDVVVPTDDSDSELLLSLENIETDVVSRLPLNSTIAIPDVFTKQNTDLDRVHSVSASLLENSYQSELKGNRRIHRFAIEVLGQVGDNTELDYITGLEDNVGLHFVAIEDGVHDRESPVQVNYSSHPLAVYFVLDVSGSMVGSGQSAALLDAASRAAITLAPGSDFDVRVFADNVFRKPELRNIVFDDPSRSATALYYAIDSALIDIEKLSLQNQDKILLVFTDGRDLASRNYYPALTTTASMTQYIVDRVALVAQAQQSFYQRNLSTHVISFEQHAGDIDTTVLKDIAKAGNGQYYNVNDPENNFGNDNISSAFDRVVKNVRGTYYLEYSSQQTSDNTALTLKIQIGEHIAEVNLP